MTLKLTLQKRDIGDSEDNEYMVVSVNVVGRARRRPPVVRFFCDEGTQTSYEPPPPPLLYGPPDVSELFTNKDPHFMAFVRENNINTLEQMLEAADVLTELWNC